MDPMNSMDMPFSHLLVGALLRGLELIPLILLMGWQGFLVMILRSDTIVSQGLDSRNCILRIDRWLTIGALTVTLAAMAVGFGHTSAMMSRRSLSQLGPLIWPILTKTHFGNVLIGQAAVWMCFALVWSRRSSAPDLMTKGRGLLLSLGALWCLTQSLSGHSADHGNWSADVLSDWLHLMAVSFWVGGVIVLALLTPALMRCCEPAAARALCIRLLERFSPLAMSCVAVLVAAGLFTAHRRGVALLEPLQSDYGDLVVFKVVLTAVAVGLGGFSKFIVLPALRREGSGGVTTIGRFRRAIGVEACVVVLVILAASVLTQMPPAGNVSLTSGPMTHPPMEHSRMNHSTMEKNGEQDGNHAGTDPSSSMDDRNHGNGGEDHAMPDSMHQ